jgi:hypothetical protein
LRKLPCPFYSSSLYTINETLPEIWNYFIGGYQVLNKWLKDRKGKYLTDEEIKTYIKIIEALKQTLVLQKEIDKLYPEIEKKLINAQLTLKKN